MCWPAAVSEVSHRPCCDSAAASAVPLALAPESLRCQAPSPGWAGCRQDWEGQSEESSWICDMGGPSMGVGGARVSVILLGVLQHVPSTAAPQCHV